MKNYTSDYTNILDAVNNKAPKRIPIYEHNISEEIMEKVLNINFKQLYNGNLKDIDEFFKHYCNFFETMTYDTISFEAIFSDTMPGNGALYGHEPGCIKDYDDFKKYPWDKLPSLYFEKNTKYFNSIIKHVPKGMSLVGGIGNGIFECVQDIVGFTNLCYMKVDDPETYEMIFKKMGEVLYKTWELFLPLYKDDFCVMRFGDDLGYKSNTLLPPNDVVNFILPEYKKIINLIHSHNKPFLLHSCGNLFEIMDQVLATGINAKHSNEDIIAPMSVWYDKYGDKIGNFGGIDADLLCRTDSEGLKHYISNLYKLALNANGVALGSGNSIPEYIPVDNYVLMIETINNLRL